VGKLDGVLRKYVPPLTEAQINEIIFEHERIVNEELLEAKAEHRTETGPSSENDEVTVMNVIMAGSKRDEPLKPSKPNMEKTANG